MDLTTFERIPLDQIAPEDVMALHNRADVRRHLPLAPVSFERSHYQLWLADKQQQWNEHGYGPWAFLLNHRFVGWGGLQPEHHPDGRREADLALILTPDTHGLGRALVSLFLAEAFTDLQLEAVTLLLPFSRPLSRLLMKQGFVQDRDVRIGAVAFRCYRLSNRDWLAGHESFRAGRRG